MTHSTPTIITQPKSISIISNSELFIKIKSSILIMFWIVIESNHFLELCIQVVGIVNLTFYTRYVMLCTITFISKKGVMIGNRWAIRVSRGYISPYILVLPALLWLNTLTLSGSLILYRIYNHKWSVYVILNIYI